MMFCWIYIYIVAIKGVTALPEYHQDDYDVKFERGEILWYNSSFLRNFSMTFPFYNRTMRVLNINGYIVNDMTSTEFVLEVQFYKFLSNEYREFPLRVAGNMCTEYANNNFNIQELLRKTSNVTSCPLKKGYYYVHNFLLDYSRMPPFIPRGRYKNVGKAYYNKHFIGEGETCFEIVDKPLKWLK